MKSTALYLHATLTLTFTLTLTLTFTPHPTLAGWGEALFKEVAKEVVKDKAKDVIVDQITKSDPNYEGPKTADEAAAEAAALDASVAELDLEPVDARRGIDGERNIRRLKKQTRRVAVAGFRVAFVLSNVATASENNSLLNLGNTAGSATGITTVHQDRSVKKEKLLYNVSEADMQAITDAAYATFVADLTASGVEVVPAETVLQSPYFAEIETTPNPFKKDSGWFRPNDIHIYSPTGLPLYFGHFDANFGNKGPLATGTWKTLNNIAHEEDLIVIIPQFVVNFAAMQSSGNRSLFRKAEVKAENVVHLANAQTMMHAFHSKKPSAGGDFGTLSLKKGYYVPGQFAVDYLIDESDNASFVNAVTRLTGTAGNIRSTETWAVYANPAVFQAYATAAIDRVGDAFIAHLAE